MFSGWTLLELAVFLAFGLTKAPQIWSLLPWFRARCLSVAQCSQAARSSLHSKMSRRAHADKVVRLLSKTLCWFKRVLRTARLRRSKCTKIGC